MGDQHMVFDLSIVDYAIKVDMQFLLSTLSI